MAEPTITHQMDEQDLLRFENLMLKELIMEQNKKNARAEFQSKLVEKYKVGEDMDLSVDGESKTIILSPRS